MRPIWIIAAVILLSVPTAGQEIIPADSSRSQPDTTVLDSLHHNIDSLKAIADTTSIKGIDTVVTYNSADSITYSITTKTMSLYSQGDIKYQQLELRGERIDINWDSSTMSAHGVTDSSDTTGKKILGAPIMKDGGEEYHGKQLGYNFKTKKGRITIADTKIDQGFYHGDRIKKMDQDVLFVADGRYTTCDRPEPHYFFGSPKMKVMPGDKVIAEPVYLYIADVPIFWLPLGVFPSKGGRRSGIIAPAIAEDATHGRILRHLGYYWAMNDYMDINLKSDLYTKGSWGLSSNYRYNLRYYLNGNVSAEYRKILEGESGDPGRRTNESYTLGFFHNQSIDPTTSLNVNFTFASSNAYQNTIDLNQALQQDITSNATLSKRWDETNSTTLNVGRRQNLLDGSIYETLPSLSFSHSGSYPFRFGRKSSADLSDLAWYEMISVSYGANLTNNRSKINTKVNGVKTQINGRDTVHTVEEFERDHSQVLSQGMSLNIAPKLGHFTISPSLSYQDNRTFISNDVPQVNASDSSSVAIVTQKQSVRSGVISSGVGLSTKLYGIVQPGMFGIAALRHTLTPSLSFTYSKQIIGENLAPKQMVASLGIGNIFEMKTASSEEGKEPGKIQLLNANAGISYNFSADSLNFSPIGVGFRTAIGSLLDINGNAGFDLYQLDPVTYRKVNKFLVQYEGRLARLTNFGISLSTSLSGERKSSSKSSPADSVSRRSESRIYGLFAEEEPDFSIPWHLGMTFDYSETKVPPFPSHAASVRGSLDFNLTEAWKFSFTGGYDITNKEVVVPSINISRDLHCWMMNFSWVPTGAYRHYQFEIRLRAPQLQDIKVTKQGSDRGIY